MTQNHVTGNDPHGHSECDCDIEIIKLKEVIVSKDQSLKKLREELDKSKKCEWCGSNDLVCWKAWKEERDTLKSSQERLVKALKSMTEKQSKREGSKLFNKDLIIHTASPNEHPETGEAIAECYICSALNSVGK